MFVCLFAFILFGVCFLFVCLFFACLFAFELLFACLLPHFLTRLSRRPPGRR